MGENRWCSPHQLIMGQWLPDREVRSGHYQPMWSRCRFARQHFSQWLFSAGVLLTDRPDSGVVF